MIFDLAVGAHMFVCACPLEPKVNSIAGWCGSGGNALLVVEEGGRGRLMLLL